jgi:glycosyltransferase involved in cell wall biosynthesis
MNAERSAQLDEELSAARVSLAPLRFGAGVKGKVVDALGRGLPVVGTGVALEGLDGVEVSGAAWVADEPDGIAAAVAALGDDDLRRTAAAAGPAWVQPRYGTGAHSAAVALWLAATESRASRRADMVE